MKTCPVCRGEKQNSQGVCDVCNGVGKIPLEARVGILPKRKGATDLVFELTQLGFKEFSAFVKATSELVSDLARYDSPWAILAVIILATTVVSIIHFTGPPTSGSEDCAKACGPHGMDHYDRQNLGCYCNKATVPSGSP